jgi:nucleotide-binding universal stress UspA family protein
MPYLHKAEEVAVVVVTVMGGYGHLRLGEWLLGGVTYNLLHEAPVPLLMAH